MNNIPIHNVWFDDAATLAMGEAFDRACKSFRNLGSAVPEIIAYLIIKAAKTGERAPRPPVWASIKGLSHRRYVDAGR